MPLVKLYGFCLKYCAYIVHPCHPYIEILPTLWWSSGNSQNGANVGTFLTNVHFYLHSLIPRPSHYPITYTMQKWRGRCGQFYHVNDINVYLGRWRRKEVPDWKNTFCTHILCPERVVSFPLHECSELQHLDSCYKERLSARSFVQRLLPPPLST